MAQQTVLRQVAKRQFLARRTRVPDMHVVGARLMRDSTEQVFAAQPDESFLLEYLHRHTLQGFSARAFGIQSTEQLVYFLLRASLPAIGQDARLFLLHFPLKTRAVLCVVTVPVVGIFRVFSKEV